MSGSAVGPDSVRHDSFALMSPEPQPQHWLTKKEAAEYLNCSTRHIERLAEQGKLRTKYDPPLPHQTGPVAVFHADDLDAVKEGKPNYYPRVEKAPAPAARESEQSKAVVLPNVNREGTAPEALMAHLLRAVPPPQKAWLGLRDAADATGLTVGFIRARLPVLIERGECVNAGSEKNPRWRVLRAALERPLG